MGPTIPFYKKKYKKSRGPQKRVERQERQEKKRQNTKMRLAKFYTSRITITIPNFNSIKKIFFQKFKQFDIHTLLFCDVSLLCIYPILSLSQIFKVFSYVVE